MGLVKRTYVDGETVITADNLNDIQDEIIQNASDISTKGTYSKPSGGIPSTDMTTDVQTSLGKADTAYQKPSGGIPLTDLASAVQTSLGKADTAYQKPSGGIPSTDLASAVQTSLGKADTALQSSDIDSTLTVSGKAADAKKTGDEISGVKNTLNQLDQNMAYVESGNTASRTYTYGQFISWKGTLYTVSATDGIPTGTAFAVGTNLAAVTGGGFDSLRRMFNERIVSVWTNPNPLQDFGRQTVSIDLSKARMISVLYGYNSSGAGLRTSKVYPFISVRDCTIFSNTNGAFSLLTRDVTWYTYAVVFSDCYTYTTVGSSQVDNSKMIPIKILAIY